MVITRRLSSLLQRLGQPLAAPYRRSRFVKHISKPRSYWIGLLQQLQCSARISMALLQITVHLLMSFLPFREVPRVLGVAPMLDAIPRIGGLWWWVKNPPPSGSTGPMASGTAWLPARRRCRDAQANAPCRATPPVINATRKRPNVYRLFHPFELAWSTSEKSPLIDLSFVACFQPSARYSFFLVCAPF